MVIPMIKKIKKCILDCICFHDDGVAAGTAGYAGGTAITSALIKNDDGKIDDDPQGRLPNLMAVIGCENDVLTTDVARLSFWQLQPNKWPNTRRLVGNMIWHPNEISESAAGTIQPLIPQQVVMEQMFDIPMTKDMDWISGDSKIAGPIVNADMGLIWAYSYGPRYPWNPYARLHKIVKVADNAIAAADVFDEAWSEQLTGVTPGLDETKDYIIRGTIVEPSAKDKGAIFGRVGTQKSPYKMIGVGSFNHAQRVETIWAFDGIPIHGLTGLTFEHLFAATDTPYGGVILEEVGEAYNQPPRGGRQTPPGGGGGGVPGAVGNRFRGLGGGTPTRPVGGSRPGGQVTNMRQALGGMGQLLQMGRGLLGR